ncbi:MAG: hypothetical protein ACI4I5_01500 [Acutalibacteraceae bacterium]|nr:hypothetical protein [Oscillospiraceae bacterium]
MGRCRLRGFGPVVIAFGLGLITAQVLPYSVLLIVAAASLIFIGTAVCRC